MFPEKIYIFGAHSRARTLAAYLRRLCPGTAVAAYLYDDEEGNPERIDGTEVIRIDGQADFHTDYPVCIATRGVSHGRITGKLRGMGFREIHPVTVELDMRLRNAYLERHFAGMGREFRKIDRLPGAAGGAAEGGGTPAVYVAVSSRDKPLRQPCALRPYEKEILAGAALSGGQGRGSAVTDDTGENISARNRQFCELTALYWIWKNTREDIAGLEHYRRRFLLPEGWQGRMLGHGVDVVLPVPLYAAPSLEGNYRERHGEAEWECMMGCLRERDRQESRAAEEFFRGNLYSPCNMLIARREALEGLCGWLFPVLFAVAERTGEKGDSYQNRYPGFLSERLISFFFERHRDRYRVAYADKNFLE